MIEEFKISSKMRDLNIKFNQEVFNKGFELYEDRVVSKFSKLDLGFFYEGDPKDEVEPSIIAVDLPLVELANEEPGLIDAAMNSSAAPPEV